MKKPWDPLPYATSGDADPEKTYAGVGAALSQWEALEFSFSRIYSIFAGEPDGDCMREYGTGKIFRDRIAILERKAEQFFIKAPNQADEGELNRLVDHAVKYSSRRNDIAHGIVMNVQNIQFFQSAMPLLDLNNVGYVLVPPWHSLRQHRPNGEPFYALNKVQLDLFAVRFHDLERQVEKFRLHLGGRPPKALKPPPSLSRGNV